MKRSLPDARPVSRRDFAWQVTGGMAAVALAEACAGTPGVAGGDAGDAATADTGALPVDSGSGVDAGVDAGIVADSGLDARSTCTLYPRSTEGPFYLDLAMLRRDVTGGRPGAALRLIVEVFDATRCAPLRDLAVDIWQCDAGGVYSGFPGQLGGLDTTGMTFLRGTQVSDENGIATFDTIYPGWYPGRTTHIHFKVHLSSTLEAVSQIYFPESVNAAVYRTGVYAARGQKDTPNTDDGVVRASGLPPIATVTSEGSGYVARIRVSIAL